MRNLVLLVAVLPMWISEAVPANAGDLGQRLAPNYGHAQPGRVKSMLLRLSRRSDGRVQRQWTEHELNEGDIVFFQTRDTAWQSIFASFGSPGPTHVGLLVRQDNELGLLHALDPHFKFKSALSDRQGVKPGQVCWTSDAEQYLSDYDGAVWVRPLRGTLAIDASKRLTAWAKRQIGKPYGIHKLALPPLGLPVQLLHWGGPAQIEGDSWFCSELVASALVVTRHLSPWHVRPVRTDPEDLFSDRLLNLHPAWESPLSWSSSDRVMPRNADPQGSDQRQDPQVALGASSRQDRDQRGLVTLTIQNPTSHTYRLTLNGQDLGDLPPRHEVSAIGPGGDMKLVAQSSSRPVSAVQLKGYLAADATWNLQP